MAILVKRLLRGVRLTLSRPGPQSSLLVLGGRSSSSVVLAACLLSPLALAVIFVDVMIQTTEMLTFFDHTGKCAIMENLEPVLHLS